METNIQTREITPSTFVLDQEQRVRLSKSAGPNLLIYLNSVSKLLKGDNQFRPTVNLDLTLNGQRLLYHHKDSKYLSLFGGGIDDDDILTAITREIFEETGLTPDKIDSIQYIGGDYLRNRPDKELRDGYTDGKYYFVFKVQLNSSVQLEDIVLEDSVDVIVQTETTPDSLRLLSAEKANLVLGLLGP
jgi:8-oxo-dGTP pyrophosphatase MutT (NUDIX family)